MAINLDDLQQRLCHQLCATVRVEPRPDGELMLATDFEYPDGDCYPIYLSETLGGIRLSDKGDMLMRISYNHDIHTLPANESPPILNKGFEETLLKNGEAERTTNTESRPSTTKVEHSNRRTHAQMVRDAQAKYMDLDVSDREMCDEILKWYSTSVRGGGDDTLDPIRWDQTGPSSEAYWFYFAVCNPWRVWSALKEVSEGCQGRPLFRGTVLKRLSRVRRALAREMERGEAWEQEAVRAEIRRVLEVAG